MHKMLNTFINYWVISDLSAIPTMVDKIKSFKAEQSRDSSITYELQVKNCGGYFVYRLGPTMTKDSGYCFGKRTK